MGAPRARIRSAVDAGERHPGVAQPLRVFEAFPRKCELRSWKAGRYNAALARRRTQVVREQSAKLRCSGSNPLGASKPLYWNNVRKGENREIDGVSAGC